MREKWKKYVEKFKSLGDKVSGVKGITAVIPAVCLAVLMVMVLTGYKTPQAKKYEASETEDISQIKEALAKESTAAMAETTKKNTTKKGKKGAIDVKDGTYKGSANGYGGKVTVNVTVSKKTMTAIDIVSAPGETDSFFNRAKGVIDEMLTAQSTDVDVVSGATYSSNGIIGAVKNALFGTESNNATAANAGNAAGSAPSVSKVSESGTWKDGTDTLARYAPFAEDISMRTDITTIAVALPGYSKSSTNNFTSLSHEGVENLAAKKEYVEFLGELVKALKKKYEAGKITYIGHSAGCIMGATLTGLKPMLIDNLVCAGGVYDIKKEKPNLKDAISIVDVLDKVDKQTKFVLIYGTADDISKPQTTIDFYNLAKAKGLDVKLVEAKDAPHIDLDMTPESIDAITELLVEE